MYRVALNYKFLHSYYTWSNWLLRSDTLWTKLHVHIVVFGININAINIDKRFNQTIRFDWFQTICIIDLQIRACSSLSYVVSTLINITWMHYLHNYFEYTLKGRIAAMEFDYQLSRTVILEDYIFAIIPRFKNVPINVLQLQFFFCVKILSREKQAIFVGTFNYRHTKTIRVPMLKRVNYRHSRRLKSD